MFSWISVIMVIQAANDELDSFIKTGDELARPLQRALQINMWESCSAYQRKDFPDFSQEFNVNIQVSVDENNDQVLKNNLFH